MRDFRQTRCLELYISMKNKKSENATNYRISLEYHMLLKNAFYGQNCGNLRNCSDIHILLELGKVAIFAGSTGLSECVCLPQ